LLYHKLATALGFIYRHKFPTLLLYHKLATALDSFGAFTSYKLALFIVTSFPRYCYTTNLWQLWVINLHYLSSQVSYAIAIPQTCDSFGLYLSSQVSHAIAIPQTWDSIGIIYRHKFPTLLPYHKLATALGFIYRHKFPTLLLYHKLATALE